MGQRSQIYVAVKSSEKKDLDGRTVKKSSNFLVARYYQWNYGSRMVSRARGLIEWLVEHAQYIDYEIGRIKRVADINFDMRDIAVSTDCIKEYIENVIDMFREQDNNDGKLFVTLDKDGTIKYAFTDGDIEKVMTAEQYMAWGKYATEEKDGSNYTENKEYLSQFTLMTMDEIEAFINADYTNVPKKRRI